jgi:signal transduction histidine kinase
MHYQDCLTRASEADAQADCTTSYDMSEVFRERSDVEAHGGHMWLVDSAGVGTDFHFTLPVADGDW